MTNFGNTLIELKNLISNKLGNNTPKPTNNQGEIISYAPSGRSH